MKHPCIGCGLRYSSYCMGCEMKLFGIGALPIPDSYTPKRKSKPVSTGKQPDMAISMDRNNPTIIRKNSSG